MKKTTYRLAGLTAAVALGHGRLQRSFHHHQ